MFKKILIATDFSKESQAALRAAISLAERCLASLHCVSVVPFDSEMYGMPNVFGALADVPMQLRDQLEQFFPERLYPNSKRQVLVHFSVAESIENYAKREGCDLIVVGNHGRGAVGRLFMGSVAQRLVRDSEIPVMVVKDVSHIEQRYQSFARVLVPTDFSQTAEKSLKLGEQFANFLRADLHLVHVVDLPTVTDFTGLYPFLQLQIPDPSQLNVDHTLRAMVKNEDLIGDLHVATLLGDPTREILNYVDKNNIDFIVLATHGRRGIDRALLGSVTANLITKSHIPVITCAPTKPVKTEVVAEKKKTADLVLL